MKSKLLNKFLSFSFGSVGGAAIAFITTMITTRILPPEEFGKTSMFTLFVSLAMIVAVFGTDQAFVRFFYEENEEKRGILLYNCLKVSFFSLIPVIVLIIIMREKLLLLLFSDYDLNIFLLILIAVVIQLFYRFGTLVIRMQQKGKVFSVLEILNKSFILIGVILFYQIFGKTYEILVYSSVLSFLLILFFLVVTQKNYWRFNNFKSNNQYHSKAQIFSYSYPLVFTTALMWVLEGVDKFAIRHWADFNQLGLYAAAFKIIGVLSILQIAFTTFWTPVAFESFERNPNNTLFYENISKIVSFLMFTVAILVIMMKDIIIQLLGSDFKDSSLMLSFLVFIPIMYTISETTVIGINFHKKVKWHIVIAGVTCMVNILGNWFLVPKYGGIGAAVSTGVSYVVFFTLRTVISLKYYKVNYGLLKIYTSIGFLMIFASYTLISFQPVNEQIIGLITLGIITLIYLKDLKRSINLYKGAA
jgi:O-antigen/teichoic acid export membrane protein